MKLIIVIFVALAGMTGCKDQPKAFGEAKAALDECGKCGAKDAKCVNAAVEKYNAAMDKIEGNVSVSRQEKSAFEHAQSACEMKQRFAK